MISGRAKHNAVLQNRHVNGDKTFPSLTKNTGSDRIFGTLLHSFLVKCNRIALTDQTSRYFPGQIFVCFSSITRKQCQGQEKNINTRGLTSPYLPSRLALEQYNPESFDTSHLKTIFPRIPIY